MNVLCTSVSCSFLCTALLETATVALGGRPMYLEKRKGGGRGNVYREYNVIMLKDNITWVGIDIDLHVGHSTV